MEKFNGIEISKEMKSLFEESEFIVTEHRPYKIINDSVIAYVGKYKNGNPKFKKYDIHNVGPDGILCSDLETFITWDKF